MAQKIDTVRAELIHAIEVKKFNTIPKHERLTLTRDNGKEFGDLDMDLEKKTKLKVYRAHPYHSWERATNEN